MNDKHKIISGLMLLSGVGAMVGCQQTTGKDEAGVPNILFVISDDQSFPHAGAYGCTWVKTPAFDHVASQGILFNNAYTPNAKCSPSRSSILTGRNSWQLEAAANHVPYFPAKFKTFTEALRDHGYFTGYTGKGWAPGDAGMINGIPRDLVALPFQEHKLVPPTTEISNNDYAANFNAFLDANTEGKPFFFWFGAWEPHRAYEYGTGVSVGGKSLSEIDRVFEFWPDNDTVRNDMLDYAFEIEHFDSHLEMMLHALDEKGLLDNTIVVVTSDNGMPFPRIKGNTYELANHLPLAIMWPKGIKRPGRIVDGYISFIDFAPTFLELAGISYEASGMQPITGKSIVPVLKNKRGATGRDYVVLGRERTDIGRPNDEGYPIRAIVKEGFMYLKNHEHSRWPAGNPETGYLDVDGSPTKSYILNKRRRLGNSHYWDLNFGKRPREELYYIHDDPDCVNNLADNQDYAAILTDLRTILLAELESEKDPRMLGEGHIFDEYPYAEPIRRNFYEKFMAGEDIPTTWVNKTDRETELLPSGNQ